MNISPNDLRVIRVLTNKLKEDASLIVDPHWAAIQYWAENIINNYDDRFCVRKGQEDEDKSAPPTA